MKGARRLLGPLLATAVVTVVVVPVAQGSIYERFRFVDEPYSFETEICGIDVMVEGTDSGHGRVRTGKGKLATAFFENVNFSYSETWTAANGRFVTVTGNASFHEVKAVALGDATPGGVLIEEFEPSVRGPHPGFDDETLCPVLVPLLTGA